jgi:hypothetical protein
VRLPISLFSFSNMFELDIFLESSAKKE